MRLKTIFILLFCLRIVITPAQIKDSVYSVKFVSATDSLELPSTYVEVLGIKMWEAGANGMIRIKQTELNEYKKDVKFFAIKVGYERVKFSKDQLILNGTVVIKIKKIPVYLDEIQIVAYKVPLIEPQLEYLTRRQRRKLLKQKKVVEIKDTAICYSKEELNLYESIVSGKWKIADSLKSKTTADPRTWMMYWKKNLKYPLAARDWNIEERIYIGWEINEKGDMQNLKLLRGKNPVLVLEVFRLLAKMPVLKIYTDPWAQKQVEPLQFIIPIYFNLK